jgi:hypothetical protein
MRGRDDVDVAHAIPVLEGRRSEYTSPDYLMPWVEGAAPRQVVAIRSSDFPRSEAHFALQTQEDGYMPPTLLWTAEDVRGTHPVVNGRRTATFPPTWEHVVAAAVKQHPGYTASIYVRYNIDNPLVQFWHANPLDGLPERGRTDWISSQIKQTLSESTDRDTLLRLLALVAADYPPRYSSETFKLLGRAVKRFSAQFCAAWHELEKMVGSEIPHCIFLRSDAAGLMVSPAGVQSLGPQDLMDHVPAPGEDWTVRAVSPSEEDSESSDT